jgi:hypothetical protein
MLVYKITFVKNRIESCNIAEQKAMKESYIIQQYNGSLIHAFIKAESMEVAQARALELISQQLSSSGA